MLRTKLAGVELRNPLILASGILGDTGPSLKRAYEAGAGAVTTKSINATEREGHPNPIIVEYEHGLLNAVGLSSQPAEKFLNEIDAYSFPIIVSVQGRKPEDYVSVIKRLEQKAAIFELNLSCPNIEGIMPAGDPGEVKKIVSLASASTQKPVFVKLSPNVPDIASIAMAAERAGADGITAINTVGPGMVIDIETKQPILSFKKGGVSGPAIRPVAVRCIYDIYEAVEIPIIGVGGVLTWADAVEFVLAGAVGIGVGTAIMYSGLPIFKEIEQGLSAYLKKNKFSSLDELRGLAHE
ncbi:MAG: dihydroorotate dehydrogenase [archaeon]